MANVLLVVVLLQLLLQVSAGNEIFSSSPDSNADADSNSDSLPVYPNPFVHRINDTNNYFYMDNSFLSSSANLSDWMAETKFLSNLTLTELTLPGSHDSGAYQLSSDLGPFDTGSPVMNAIIRLAASLGLPVYEVLLPWVLSQRASQTLLQQGLDGQRYFDVRFAWTGSQWRCHHGLLGVEARVLLQDLMTFITAHKGEIIIVEISHLEPIPGVSIDDKAMLALQTIITDVFAPLMTPCKLARSLTFSQLVANAHNVIISVDDSIIVNEDIGLCNSTTFLYNTYANSDDVPTMIQFDTDTIREFNRQAKETVAIRPKKPFWLSSSSAASSAASNWQRLTKISFTLTPQPSTIFNSLLPGYPKSLLQLSSHASLVMASFMSTIDSYKWQAGNIFLADDASNTPIVTLAIANMAGRLAAKQSKISSN